MLASEKLSRKHRGLHLLSHHLHDYTLVPLSVEFRVENALPRAEVEPSGGDWDDDLMVYQQGLEMGITVRFARIMVAIILAKGRQLLQPLVDIFDEPSLVVIHINARRYVHGRDQNHAFLHTAFLKDGFDLGSDVNVFAVLAGMKLQVFGVEFHGDSLRYRHTRPQTA